MEYLYVRFNTHSRSFERAEKYDGPWFTCSNAEASEIMREEGSVVLYVEHEDY